MTYTIQNLISRFEELKLPKMAENINTYLDMIVDGRKTVLESLGELCELELSNKTSMAIKGCVKVANFPFLKEIKDFDFSYQPCIDKSKIMDLMTLRFIEKAENIIFCGTPGVGKTNLAVSIGIEAAKQRYSVYFISFHEMMAQLKQARHENRLEAKIKLFCR